MNEAQSIYGGNLPAMDWVLNRVLSDIEVIRNDLTLQFGNDPVEHIRTRIKSDESMHDKCRRRGLDETVDSALSVIRDAIGVRVVCQFLNDVFAIADFFSSRPGIEVVECKDYIRRAKPNGYRSYHMILRVRYEGGAPSDYDSYFVEVQLRTISQDTWASLEHTLKYKKDIADAELICAELKRCADELESTDISMQTLRDLIISL
ncbi:MAG: GTP pyrophosphokinase family protein [Clostridia bacterium]|nr:GTP pyrophosphokinase family protein [Clostridia bacterium]